MGFISHRLCSHPKIWTKCVKNYLSQVHDQEEQSCFSLSFQRKPSNKTPHAVTHLTHSHTLCTLIGTGFCAPERDHWGNSIKPLLSLHVSHWYPYSLVKAVRVRQLLFQMHQGPPLQWLNEKATIISGWSKSSSAAFGHVEKVKVVGMKTLSTVD